MKCEWKTCNVSVKPYRSWQKFCSRQCGNKSKVAKRRRTLKEKAVIYKGGKCEKCGYCKYIEALQFHHKDSSQKEFGIAAKGITRSWEKVKIEIDKCILLCANCHAEKHAEHRLDTLKQS